VPSPFPYLDAGGFAVRSVMPTADVQLVTTKEPGFFEAAERRVRSMMESRLRKRYAVPFGASAPALVGVGSPPPASLSGTPRVGSIQLALRIAVAGDVGTSTFDWSSDGGLTYPQTGIATAASVALGATGLVVSFPAGAYALGQSYAATTPVPEAALWWLAAILTPEMYRARGVNPQDPQMEQLEKDRDRALAELKEAADSQDGLFDLPLLDAGESGITQGGPQAYSETSPYVGFDHQARCAREEDRDARR
jgi:hypothetical protein